MTSLFEPVAMGALELKNRVFMAPLTRNRATPQGVPGEHAAIYYSQRASAGLIISEATQISPLGKGYLNTPGIYNDEQVQAWKKVTDAVHAEGGRIFIQLWHVGRISHVSLLPPGESPVSPSAITANSQTFIETGMVDVSAPRALDLDEIKQVVMQYRQAAECARQAGFDGVEIHAANGYLIDQFLQDKTNHRQDNYGGDIDSRMRFLLEVIEAVTGVFNPNRVGLRLSPTGTFNDMGDSDPLNHFGRVIDRLNDFGLAYLHVVERFPGIDSSAEDEATVRQLIDRWHGFYVANGNYDADTGMQVVEQQRADAVAYGRPFIANPDLPLRLESHAELNVPDEATFYGGDHHGYTDYSFLGDQ